LPFHCVAGNRYHVAEFRVWALYAQVAPRPDSDPAIPGDRSSYLGRQVTNPEALSGFWETSNGHGGAVGIHLLLMTTVLTEGWYSAGDAPQSWEHLNLDVYERRGAKTGPDEDNGFSDSPRGGNVSFRGGHLKLQFPSTLPSDPSIDVDLILQPDDTWVGRLHRGGFDSHVVLSRPGASLPPNPLVGTWIAGRGVHLAYLACAHIAQRAPNEFIGWTSSIPRALGASNMTIPGLPKPKTQYLSYGRPIGIKLEDGGKILFDPNDGNGVCCGQTFMGKLTADGKFIQGSRWGTESAQDASLRKIQGDSCIIANAVESKLPEKSGFR
jgi:hypothetical protein